MRCRVFVAEESFERACLWRPRESSIRAAASSSELSPAASLGPTPLPSPPGPFATFRTRPTGVSTMRLFRSSEILGIAEDALQFALAASEDAHPHEYMGFLRGEDARSLGLERDGT